jgi:16S rRNA processing protein RimM
MPQQQLLPKALQNNQRFRRLLTGGMETCRPSSVSASSVSPILCFPHPLFPKRQSPSKRTPEPQRESPMAKLENPILMATIGAPQGLRGEVRVRTFTADPHALGDYGHLHSMDGRVFEILDLREAKTVVIVRFRGINDRDTAEKLNGLELFIDRDNLPDEELDDDEFYYADLEGLDAVDGEGKSYGKVSGVFDFGAGDLLELKGPGRRPTLIPFSEAAVLEIDLDKGRIVIDPMAAGLIDTPEEDEAMRRATEGDPEGGDEPPQAAGGKKSGGKKGSGKKGADKNRDPE